MAQLTKCDRCGKILDDSEAAEQVTVRGVRVDVCPTCSAELFDPWVGEVVARVSTVPTVPAGQLARRFGPAGEAEARRGARPPQHGFTAASIEAAAAVDVVPSTGRGRG